jgi:hypothetical protein
MGPTMELATPVNVPGGREIAIDGGRVSVRDGMIRLTRRGTPGRPDDVRAIGPGRPLAATATGRFILALVPQAAAVRNVMGARPVIYHVPPR